MKHIIHKAESRGYANHGWLKSYHTFSFAGYHNPERVHFGMLRVLNDDFVDAGMGFGKHPHDNMEIISIPLSGALHHQDSTGRDKIIQTGDVQIMSAGTGIFHSEVNASQVEPVTFLQLWIFPKVNNIEPRYDQKEFNVADRTNQFQVVVSPTQENDSLFINQDAWLSLIELEEGKEALNRTLLMMNYDMKKTLTENVEVISEQENVGGNPEDLQIAIKIRKATTDVLGTDEDAFEEALNLIKLDSH